MSMSVKEYQNLKGKIEKANKALTDLLDSLSGIESETKSMFGDAMVDINSMNRVLEAADTVQEIERNLNAEYRRIQSNKLVEVHQFLAGGKPAENQLSLTE